MAENRDFEKEGMGEQIKGKAQELWGKMTGQESEVLKGKAEGVAGKIKEHLGRAANEVERRTDTDEHEHRL